MKRKKKIKIQNLSGGPPPQIAGSGGKIGTRESIATPGLGHCEDLAYTQWSKEKGG